MKPLSCLLVVGLVVATSSYADDAGLKLAQSKGCLACHSVDHKIVGPAYKDVAAKYKSDAGALNRLAAKVRSGGTGVWGTAAMPPNNVTDAEAHTLVKWVLSQAK